MGLKLLGELETGVDLGVTVEKSIATACEPTPIERDAVHLRYSWMP